MIKKRRKGVAIVDTPKGILVVAGRSKKFMLPGGGAKRGESRRKAAIRELYEETGLKAIKVKYLFSYVGRKWHTKKGSIVRNYAKVFLIEAKGNPRPRSEIKYIAFWRPGSKLNITKGTKKIISKYIEIKSHK